MSRTRVLRRTGLATLGALAAVSLVACDSSSSNDDGQLVVAAAFYPLAEIVRNVAGDQATVVTIVPPGEEAHEYEPTPKELTQLEKADVVVYLGDGFQPSVEKAIESLPDSVVKIDLLEGLSLLPAGGGGTVGDTGGTTGTEEVEGLESGADPHVWLDPANMKAMTERVAAAIPGSEDGRDAYLTQLDELDAQFTEGLAECDSRILVSGHRAFAYLAAAYDLEAVSIAGISPSEEPSAQTLEDVAAFAKDNGVTTIFFEENLPDDLARTVADEIGASTAVLDPIESPSGDQLDANATYVSLMQDNLAALRAGLGCG